MLIMLQQHLMMPHRLLMLLVILPRYVLLNRLILYLDQFKLKPLRHPVPFSQRFQSNEQGYIIDE